MLVTPRVCVVEQRGLLLAGGIRRMVALLQCGIASVHRALVISLHVAWTQAGKCQRLLHLGVTGSVLSCNGFGTWV